MLASKLLAKLCFVEKIRDNNWMTEAKIKLDHTKKTSNVKINKQVTFCQFGIWSLNKKCHHKCKCLQQNRKKSCKRSYDWKTSPGRAIIVREECERKRVLIISQILYEDFFSLFFKCEFWKYLHVTLLLSGCIKQVISR